MINAVGSSISGMSVHATKINTAAHNVANVNTEGYKKDRVTIHSNKASGLPETHISKVDSPGYPIHGPQGQTETSNVDLADEMVNLTMGKHGFLANLQVFKNEQERIGYVLDLLA